MLSRIIAIIVFVVTTTLSNGLLASFSITDNIDYGTVTLGSNLQPEVVIENIGTNDLVIGNIADTNPLLLPFRILNDACSNTIVLPGERCAFIVLFSPETEEVFSDSFNIELTNLSLSHEFLLTGTGGPSIDEPDITLTFTSIDFGNVDVIYSDNTSSYIARQFIRNFGKAQLDISSIDITGPNQSEINLSGGCLDTVSLDADGACFIDVEFRPLVAGDKSATLTITTNDPDESPFLVPILATALPEDDGVPASVEDAGPNNGDGNNDDVLDSEQSNIASLVNLYGSYVTYVTSAGIEFKNMVVLKQADLANNPTNLDLGSGVYSFDVEGIRSGSIIDVGLILPEGMIPSGYYVYGPTTDDTDPHWYKFDFDGDTGALIIGDALFASPSGNTMVRSVVKIRYQDGGRGDSSLVADGQINSLGGIVIAPSVDEDEGGGAIDIVFLVQLLLLTIYFRSRYK